MDKKKKKILIIVLSLCLALAAACVIVAVLLHQKSAPPSDAQETAATTAAATVSGEAPGEQYVKEENKKDYEAISSHGIKGDPDDKVKAYFYNMVKAASPEIAMKNFDLLKVYEGFRFYDTTGTTKAEGTQNFLLVVYAENGKAVLTHYEEYKDAQERADLLTEYIRDLDKNYERYAKYAKSLDGERILYE